MLIRPLRQVLQAPIAFHLAKLLHPFEQFGGGAARDVGDLQHRAQARLDDVRAGRAPAQQGSIPASDNETRTISSYFWDAALAPSPVREGNGLNPVCPGTGFGEESQYFVGDALLCIELKLGIHRQ